MNFAAAACRSAVVAGIADVNWWYATPGTKDAKAAADICAICPIRDDCRQWARDHREYGLWGGETMEQRSRAGYAPKHATHVAHRPSQRAYFAGCQCADCLDIGRRLYQKRAEKRKGALVDKARRTAGRS